MKTEQIFVPKALQQVWDWKQSVYEQYQGLPTPEVLSRILAEADHAATTMGFAPPSAEPNPASALAEQPTPYACRNKRRDR
jgi:hypothetical protein